MSPENRSCVGELDEMKKQELIITYLSGKGMLSGEDEGMYIGLMEEVFGERRVNLENRSCVGKVEEVENKS